MTDGAQNSGRITALLRPNHPELKALICNPSVSNDLLVELYKRTCGHDVMLDMPERLAELLKGLSR
jgi:hypothetical protein